MVGCGKDEISYDNPAGSQEGSEYGYLVLPEVVLVDLSSEEFDQSESRATEDSEEASDDFLVVVTNSSDNTISYSGTYGELKEIGELALRPASYNIAVDSTAEIPGVSDQAHYSCSENFVIVANMTTTLDNLSCTMSNIKVSVSFSADLLSLFKEDGESEQENLNVAISIAENSTNFTRSTNGEARYFKAVESSNSLELELTGMYNTAADNQEPSYTMIEGWKQTITGVKAGQWRNISINIDHANEGSVDFTITIDTWSYDEDIDVDITSSTYQYDITEPELDDPENYITDSGAPLVTLGSERKSLDNIFYIDQNSFALNSSLQSECVDPLIINVEPQEGATLLEMWIEFRSDNATFDSLLEYSLGEKRREYISLSSNDSEYYTYAEGSFEATFEAMYQLYCHSGTHQATIMAKDSQGRTSYSYLTIISTNEGVEEPTLSPPTIVWRGGYSFENTYVVDPNEGLEVIIDITSQSGITGFILRINSDTLTPEELEGINLAQEMDLINPGACADGLEFLNFPTGDQVKGQRAMVFDITEFMPMLVVAGSGDSHFVLEVTDAGGTTTKTLMLRVE